MPWMILVVAGLLEIGWAAGLKYSDGLTRFWPAVFTITAMVASMWLLAVAVRSLPVGTAYAVWTGIGAAGTVIAGIVFFSEPASPLRVVFIATVVAGIVGLKTTSG